MNRHSVEMTFAYVRRGRIRDSISPPRLVESTLTRAQPVPQAQRIGTIRLERPTTWSVRLRDRPRACTTVYDGCFTYVGRYRARTARTPFVNARRSTNAISPSRVPGLT